MRKKNIFLLIIMFLLLFIITISNSNDLAFKKVHSTIINDYLITHDMVLIDYASKDRVIFHYGAVFFVYDVHEEAIYRSIDMKPINKNYINGDIYTEVIISYDGNYAYFFNLGIETDDVMYKYDIEQDKVKKMKLEQIDDKYQVLLTEDIQPDNYKKLAGAYSPTICRIEDDILVYLYCPSLKLKDLQVVFLNETNQNKKVHDIFKN